MVGEHEAFCYQILHSAEEKKNTEIGGTPQVAAEDCWYIISATDYFSK